MRKFNLFDKVEFTEKNTGEKNVGCIVGFTTDEEDGYIIDKESGTCVEPDEHAYLLLIGEMQESQSRFEEFMESELSISGTATFIDRLHTEHGEFVERCNKLNEFIMTNKI